MSKKKKHTPKKSSAGKGDNPRSCFSKKYRENYNGIDWSGKKKNKG